jgi:hypothetical protein
MGVSKWVKTNVDYGRQLVGSGIEGARSGQEEFLNGKPLTPYLGESAKDALVPAAIGVCVGVLAGYPIWRHKSKVASVACGLLGGAIGLTTGLAWNNRHLGASVAGSALKNMGKTRDAQWLNKHPIDYA